MNTTFAHYFKKGFKSFWTIGLILGTAIAIAIATVLHFRSAYPDEIQIEGKTLHRYITLIRVEHSTRVSDELYRDTMSYYADSTGMPYYVASSTGSEKLYERQSGDTLFYSLPGGKTKNLNRQLIKFENFKQPMLIHDRLVRRLTPNSIEMVMKVWDITYDSHRQLQTLTLVGDGVQGKCNYGKCSGKSWNKGDHYRFVWKNGLLKEILFNEKLIYRIYYTDKRGLNAGLPALYMAGFEEISVSNDGLLYLMAGYLGRIPDAQVDRVASYNPDNGKLLETRKVDSKFDWRGRLSEYYTMSETSKGGQENVHTTLRFVY